MLVAVLVIIQIILIALTLGFLVQLVSLIVSARYQIPYVKTPIRLYSEIVSAMELREGDRFVDLGSGVGNLCFYIAGRIKHVSSVEINPFFVAFQKIKNRILGEKIEIKKEDLATVDISDSNVIYFYWEPTFISETFKSVYSRASKGTRFYSYVYEFPKEYMHEAAKYTLKDGESLYCLEKK